MLLNSTKHCVRLITVAAMVMLTACAMPMPRKDDPYENFNRKVYKFNDFADRVAIRPAALGYRKITNDTTRRLVSNFFANIESPITIANDLLQVEPKYALTASARLVINTTVGVLGLFDPASEMTIDAHATDFGVTLARWGVPEGPYIVLPLLGSTSGRDLLRLPVDSYFFDPLSYYSRNNEFRYNAEYFPSLAYLITLRSSAIDAEGLVEGAYDPYVFYRDAYRQRRLYEIYRGNPPLETIQSLQGTDDVDADKLLEEQEKYEKKNPSAAPAKQPKPTSSNN